MFDAGQVVYVVSDQAAGYKTRNKYHLCICATRNRYLFINSRNWEGAFPIKHAQFDKLPNDVSYVACNTLLYVDDKYMAGNNAELIGDLPKNVIAALIDHINECDVMTEDEKEIAIDGLTNAL